jgi:hypothetical protein
MTITQAAKELDAIRNNRTDSAESLVARVDAVGQWAASQKKNSSSLSKILGEAHDLHARLAGGLRGAGRTTIVIS